MKKINVQSPDLSALELVLNSTDEQGETVSKTYLLVYDYRAIKRAEDALGIDLKDFRKWADVKSHQMPVLVHAGLAKNHPEVALSEIEDALNPSAQALIQDAVFELLFPGVLDKLKKAQEQDKVTSPNVPSEANAAA